MLNERTQVIRDHSVLGAVPPSALHNHQASAAVRREVTLSSFSRIEPLGKRIKDLRRARANMRSKIMQHHGVPRSLSRCFRHDRS